METQGIFGVVKMMRRSKKAGTQKVINVAKEMKAGKEPAADAPSGDGSVVELREHQIRALNQLYC